MDTSKIVSLKQELVSLETQIKEFSKKVSSKRRLRTIGIICIPAFIILGALLESVPPTDEYSYSSPYNSFDLFLFLILTPIAIILLIVGIIGAGKWKKKLKMAESQTISIKKELISLEHEQ